MTSPEQLLHEIFLTKKVRDGQEHEYALDSNIDQQEGRFLQTLISTYKPQRTIEIGFAYGISSLYILGELQKVKGSHHTIIDPCQLTHFNSIGLANLKRSGVSNFEFHEALSEIALPQMLQEGRKFDLAFIDGDHRFENTLLDFFFINKMMDPGGIIVFDDTAFPAVSKVMRYILQYPAYQYIGNVPITHTAGRRFFDTVVKGSIGALAKLLPKKWQEEIFSSGVLKGNHRLHLNASMVAIKKVAEDDRNWDWYKYF